MQGGCARDARIHASSTHPLSTMLAYMSQLLHKGCHSLYVQSVTPMLYTMHCYYFGCARKEYPPQKAMGTFALYLVQGRPIGIRPSRLRTMKACVSLKWVPTRRGVRYGRGARHLTGGHGAPVSPALTLSLFTPTLSLTPVPSLSSTDPCRFVTERRWVCSCGAKGRWHEYSEIAIRFLHIDHIFWHVPEDRGDHAILGREEKE